MNKMKVSIDAIKENNSILDVAEKLGFTVVKIGNYYTLKEHDSVRINPKNNLYIQNSTGKGGTVIDFYMNFSGLSLKEALKKLSEGTITSSYKPYQEHNIVKAKHEIKDLILPKADENFKNVYAYLVSTRGIDKAIVSDFIKHKMLYQDIHKNCVFVSYKNREPMFAAVRGTNTKKRFLGDVEGSNYDYLFFIDNNGKNLVIAESVIDAMSIMSIYKSNGDNYKKNDYIALAGTQKHEGVFNHLAKKKYESILICLDNDEAGKKAAVMLEEKIKEVYPMQNIRKILPMNGKDFNEYLQILKGKQSIIGKALEKNNINNKVPRIKQSYEDDLDI